MDGKLFEEWFRELERKFAFEGRNVDFVINNCPAHCHIDNLKVIKVKIKLIKSYRKNIVRKIIQSIEKKKTLPKISLLQGTQMLVSAWDALSMQPIMNCSPKSEISSKSQDEIVNLRFVQPNLIEEEFDATTFANVDAEVIPVQNPPSDAEIVAKLLETEGVSDDDDYPAEVADDEPVKCPDKNELLQVIKILQRFSLFLDKGNKTQSYASCTESQVDQHFAKKKKKKQASIRDFLSMK